MMDYRYYKTQYGFWIVQYFSTAWSHHIKDPWCWYASVDSEDEAISLIKSIRKLNTSSTIFYPEFKYID